MPLDSIRSLLDSSDRLSVTSNDSITNPKFKSSSKKQ